MDADDSNHAIAADASDMARGPEKGGAAETLFPSSGALQQQLGKTGLAERPVRFCNRRAEKLRRMRTFVALQSEKRQTCFQKPAAEAAPSLCRKLLGSSIT